MQNEPGYASDRESEEQKVSFERRGGQDAVRGSLICGVSHDAAPATPGPLATMAPTTQSEGFAGYPILCLDTTQTGLSLACAPLIIEEAALPMIDGGTFASSRL